MNYYLRFWNKALNRPYKRLIKRPGPHGEIVPGCISDPDPRKDTKRKFDRWQKRSYAAMRLYWRTHPHLRPFPPTKWCYWSNLQVKP